MHRFLIKFLIFCFMLLFQINVIAQEGKNCHAVNQIISNFLNSKKESDWYLIEDVSYKHQKCKCELAPVFYFEHWLKILLPNSQSLIGISPNEFILSQKKQLKKQLKTLENCTVGSFLPLVEAMRQQQFDVTMKKGAEDLKQHLQSGSII